MTFMNMKELNEEDGYKIQIQTKNLVKFHIV